jgi:hypothetical protein
MEKGRCLWGNTLSFSERPFKASKRRREAPADLRPGPGMSVRPRRGEEPEGFFDWINTKVVRPRGGEEHRGFFDQIPAFGTVPVLSEGINRAQYRIHMMKPCLN